jgi:teichuronic acid biosynthesis glycosyltransferase TuaG
VSGHPLAFWRRGPAPGPPDLANGGPGSGENPVEAESELALEIRDRLSKLAEDLGLSVSRTEKESSSPPNFEPLISVLVPVHNDERFVAAALESIKRQTYDKWECIVVDDASGDSSWELIQSATAGDNRFRILRNEANLGPGGARNVAIAEARADFLAFLDADDLLTAASLEDRVDALSNWVGDPYVVGSFCGVRFSHVDTDLDDLADHYRSTQPPFIDFVVADGEAVFPMGAALISTERVRSIGGLDASMVSGGVDWELWYRILRNGHVFVASPFQSLVYRQRAGGITRGNPAAHTRAAAGLIRAAHRAADPRILVNPTPYPMLEPLGTYRAHIAVAERASRFATMALVDGDLPGMRSTLSVIEPGTWPLLARHLDIPSLVARGAARALGVKAKDLEGEQDALAPFVSTVGSEIRRVSS